MSSPGRRPSTSPSIAEVLAAAPWRDLAEHVSDWRERVDGSIRASHDLRRRFREELLAADPDLPSRIHRPSPEALARAKDLMQSGTVAAADGTVSPVPLVGGARSKSEWSLCSTRAKWWIWLPGCLSTSWPRVLTRPPSISPGCAALGRCLTWLAMPSCSSASVSSFMAQPADWRMIHGELIPHELRTGAGRPADNLEPTFNLIDRYIATGRFLACSESTSDLDVLNAAEVLEPGEYVVIRSLEHKLRLFLEGDPENGTVAAKFADTDGRRFREWMAAAGPQVAEVLVKAGHRPFLLECHVDHIDEAVALFLVDSLWMRGMTLDGSQMAVRGFPFHIDLADQAAGRLFRASDFRGFVEHRLMEVSVEDGLFDLDPRRTR